MTHTQTELARQQARDAALAQIFPVADTLEYRCGTLVEMVHDRAASNLLLAQLGAVTASAIAAVRLRIVDENSPDNWPRGEPKQDANASVSRCRVFDDRDECATHRAGCPCGACKHMVQNADARTADATDGDHRKRLGGIRAIKMARLMSCDTQRPQDADATDGESDSPISAEASPVDRMEADGRTGEGMLACSFCTRLTPAGFGRLTGHVCQYCWQGRLWKAAPA